MYFRTPKIAQGAGGGSFESSRGEGQWRFVPDSCGRRGLLGSFVRLSLGGREFPTHFVGRWPRNWGWVMQVRDLPQHALAG